MIRKIGNKQYIARTELQKLLRKLEKLEKFYDKEFRRIYRTAGYSGQGEHGAGTGDEGWKEAFSCCGQAEGLLQAAMKLESLINKGEYI